MLLRVQLKAKWQSAIILPRKVVPIVIEDNLCPI